MCGNQKPLRPHWMDDFKRNGRAGILIDEILEAVAELNKEQAEPFFEWLKQHFNENKFDFIEFSIEERLQLWLSIQSAMLLTIECQIILNKLEFLKSDHETKTF